MNLPRPLRPALLCFCLSMFPALAIAQTVSLESQEERFSYALGVQFAMQIMSQVQNSQLPIDADALIYGLSDSFANELRLSEEEMTAALNAVQQEAIAKENEMKDQLAKMGDEFRTDYEQQKGVAATQSGILYKVITVGDGAMPNAESTVTVHYRGTLTDGTEFDSSYSRNEPTEFPLNGIIPGWQEVLQLMKVGAKWEVVIPPQLAYGENGAPPAIPPNATLIFEIELLEVS